MNGKLEIQGLVALTTKEQTATNGGWGVPRPRPPEPVGAALGRAVGRYFAERRAASATRPTRGPF